MKKTHYGLVCADETRDEPPYFIYKQVGIWTEDPSNMLESTRRGEMITITHTEPRLYFCGYDENEKAHWSEDREGATSYGDRDLALIALYEAEDRDSASSS